MCYGAASDWSFLTGKFWRSRRCLLLPLRSMDRERSEAFGVEVFEQKRRKLYNCGIVNVRLVDMGEDSICIMWNDAYFILSAI